jgi:hypothetical protein
MPPRSQAPRFEQHGRMGQAGRNGAQQRRLSRSPNACSRKVSARRSLSLPSSAAERLAGGNQALALLGNTIPTGAILVVLITILGPVLGLRCSWRYVTKATELVSMRR